MRPGWFNRSNWPLWWPWCCACSAGVASEAAAISRWRRFNSHWLIWWRRLRSERMSCQALIRLVRRRCLASSRPPGTITAIRPLKEGVISDFEITEAMLSYFINKVSGKRSRIFGPRVVISVPSGITAVEKQAVYSSAERAGARRTVLCEQPMAAAIGAGLPWTEPQASMIVDIGGGTSDVAVLSLGDIAVCESLRVAGDDFDEAIMTHMKRTYNLMIGEQTAERIKIEIGSAAPTGDERTMEVRGRDMISGLPRKTVVTSEEIREALQEPVGSICDAVTRTLERAEPELAADLVENGIVLAGGGALLRGLSTVIQNATGLGVRIADDPLTCVARGTAIYLENIELVQHTLPNDTDQ